MNDVTPGPHATARELRFNAALTLVLTALIVAFGSTLTRRYVRERIDLSEDGLYTLSRATKELIGRVESPVTVRIYGTERIEDGAQALRAARVRSQIDEIVALRSDVFDVQSLDPSRSTEARDRAREANFRPSAGRRSGLGGGAEEVWLSVELGYRGRLERIPAPRPFEFELQFASALHALLTDRQIGIGWYGAPLEPPPPRDNTPEAKFEYAVKSAASTFRGIAAELSRRGRFEQLVNLEDGRSVPDDIDVLFVVRPGVVHARAAYAIDQFVQRGGRLVVCLDDPDYNLVSAAAVTRGEDVAASALHGLLAAWGAEVDPLHVWDERFASVRYQLVAGRKEPNPLRTPLVLTVPKGSLSSELPPTRDLAYVQFAWAHPLVPAEERPPPAGVTRTDLAWTSEHAWLHPLGPSLPLAQESVRVKLLSLRNEPARSYPLAAAFSGRFPSPWAGRTPPRPVEGRGLGAATGAEEASPLSSAAATQVVVFGDADWLRDPAPAEVGGQAFMAAGGLDLALNLVDWLVLDDDLIELRSRSLRLRPLRDFAAEEAEALGVFEADPYQTEAERVDRAQKLDLAEARARRKQWLTMLVPAGAALLVVLAFGVLWNLSQRPRTSGSEVRR